MCDNRQFWIVKPPNLNNGTGIHVIPNNIDSIPEYPTCVQSYIKGPLLIDGYKVYLEVLWSFLLLKKHVRGCLLIIAPDMREVLKWRFIYVAEKGILRAQWATDLKSKMNGEALNGQQ